MKTIPIQEFLSMVRLSNLEVLTQTQMKNNTEMLKGYLQKALGNSLNEEDAAEANVLTSDISAFDCCMVVREDLTKAIVYVRSAQVEWEGAEYGEFGEIIKARSGVYKNTGENRKLNRVGQKYGESKEQEIKGSNEGGKFTLVGFGDGKDNAGGVRTYIRVKDSEGIIYRKPLDKEDLNRFHTLSVGDKRKLVDKYFGEKKKEELSDLDTPIARMLKNAKQEYKSKPTTPEGHKLKIARDTLKMHPAMAGVMGGPSRKEAIQTMAKQGMAEISHSWDSATRKYFGKYKEGLTYILHNTFENIMDGQEPNRAFEEACDDQNYYGYRPDVVEDRNRVKKVLKDHFLIDVEYKR